MAHVLKAEAIRKSGGKQYVARIGGRDSKLNLARTFIGSQSGMRSEITLYETDIDGLYETCDVTLGGKLSTYHVILNCPELAEGATVLTNAGLRRFTVTEDEAMIIAKELHSGRPLREIVRVTIDPDPSIPRRAYKYKIVSPDSEANHDGELIRRIEPTTDNELKLMTALRDVLVDLHCRQGGNPYLLDSVVYANLLMSGTRCDNDAVDKIVYARKHGNGE